MTSALVVGHGLIGRLRAARLHARGALAGTVDPRPRDAALYGGVPHFASLDDAPPAAYDAAVVAVPHDLAHPLVKQLLAAGRPVLVEKPLGLTAAQASELVAAAKGRPCFVGYNYRFLPHVRLALAAVRAGRLGALRSVDLLLGHGGHPDSATDWKLDPARAGGGVIIDPGVHLLDLALLFAPGLQPVLAHGTQGFWKTGIEEDVVCVLRHDDCLATVRVSHVRWVNGFRAEVVGEDGYALLEGRGGTYGPLTLRLGRRWAWADGSRRTQRETEEVHDFGAQNDSFERETDAVLDAWAGRPGGAAATFEEAARVSELTDALYARLVRR